MPAKSKAQQRFFGMVRAAQKGEGAASPEVAKVADEISDKDAKKFAKTKHKGLPEKKKVDEGVGRAAIGAGIGAMIGGPVGAAVGGSIGASMGKKKKVTSGGPKKKPKNFFKAEPKVTSSESMEIKESVLDVVRKYAKKKKEKQPQKAQDAGARARRVLQRKEYASKVSGSTDNVPDNLRDSLQILKNLIK